MKAKRRPKREEKTWCIDEPKSRLSSEFVHSQECVPLPQRKRKG